MLVIDNVSLSYENKNIIKNLSCSIKEGKITAIIGPNGCGKSTLLKALSKNKKIDNGAIYLHGKNLSKIKQKRLAKIMAILPQNPSSPYDITARELITLGRYPFLNWRNKLTNKDAEVINWAIEKTSLTNLQDQPIVKLSGGERQRAWIAMTLAQEPKLLLLDEPTTFLDISYQYEVLELVSKLNLEMKLTIVMVLHDLNQAARYAHEIIVINNGEVYKKDKPEKVVTPQTLFEVFNMKAKVIYDEDNKCPFFIPLPSDEAF